MENVEITRHLEMQSTLEFIKGRQPSWCIGTKLGRPENPEIQQWAEMEREGICEETGRQRTKERGRNLHRIKISVKIYSTPMYDEVD